MPGPVERWLETFMCKQYADTFEAYGFKTLQSVCQLQQPQLQAMGVAQEHVDKILESVHILRQSMFGGMNHYKDEGYGSQSNVRMQHTGYIQAPQAHNVSGMNPNYNMAQVGYNSNNNNNQGNIMASHRGHMMDSIYQQQQQQQPQPQSQQYPSSLYQNQGPYHMGQYNQQNSTYGPMMNYNNQNRTQVRQPTTATSHVHSRHQNPQEVANNILQMAASYQPSQTVQVPLSKNRQAPYHVPVSAHYNMPNHVNNTEQMNRQFNYPNPSQHNTHAARTSPVSPGSMYMHSPASQHSSHSMPNSSPRSIHSPSGCGNIRSPVPSPAGSMRSPCHMQSPVNTPINQQLHVTTGQQMVQSPPQHQMGFSPKNNPLSPQGIQSPHYKQQIQKSYLNENVAAANFTANNPLQSLQKLCMLPDRQVVDPKSIVNDSSPSPNQTQKNVSSDVDWNSTISETASVNNCTDGKNCDEMDNNSGIQTNLCTNSENSCSVQNTALNTVVDSYADDAVKKSSENTIKTDVDFEHQKLKYLGQPCNTETEKQPPFECVQGTNCELSERVTNFESSKNVLETHKKSETTENSFNSLQASIETKEVSDSIFHATVVSEQINGIPKSTDHIDCIPKSSNTLHNSELTDNSLKAQKIPENSVCESESTRLEQTVEKSHDREQKSCDITDSIERSQDDQVSESVENICDKSIVNGCDNTLCDDQSKPDISSDCRKDEVKSMVNGIDDSEDNSSDIELNKKDLFIKSEPNIEILEMDSDSLLNHKTDQRQKNDEKSDNKRHLREIPPRVASASPFYVDDSDSGDEGILMVRKDVKYTYSRYSKIHRDINSHVSVSDNDTFDISDEESLDRNSLDSDMSKGFDCDIIQSLPKTVNGPGSNPGHRKKNSGSKPFKNRCSRNVISDTLGQGSKDKSENQKGNGRSKRRRTATSKYGDEMYLGDDFALDSEEETKIERKSKRKRKPSGDTSCVKANTKVKSEDVNLDSDDVEENDKKCKKNEKTETKFNCIIKSEEIVLDSDEEEETGKIDQGKQKISVDQKLPNKTYIEPDILVSVEEPEVGKTIATRRKSKLSGDIKSKVQIKEENEDSQMDSLDSKDICIDIIDSSDNLGDGSDIITFKPITKQSSSFLPVASTSKSQCENKPLVQKAKPRTKSKLKVSKAGKSKSRGKLLDDSIKNMKLKKTMNLMKQNGKKKPEVPVKEKGPILRIKDSGTPKEKCSVVNQLIEENSDKTAKNKRSTVRVSTVQVSKLPSEKSVHVPASLAGENTSWVCALCKKHSSYKFLGDLFGPYYTEGNLPEDEGSGSMDKKGKQKRQSVSVDSKSNSKGRRKSKDSMKPNEIWVHEDCAAWADGVLLIGAKMYGLQEATDIASSTVCTYCKETGAMVGCLHKGCSQKFHYYCGIESGCFLDEENYSLLCPKHRDKRLKSAEAKSFKT